MVATVVHVRWRAVVERLVVALAVVVGDEYYRCAERIRSGTCDNSLSVRESIARHAFLEALGDRLASRAAIAYVPKLAAERMGEVGSARSRDQAEHTARLKRTRERIQRLVGFIASGHSSEAVAVALSNLEAQERTERAALAAVQSSAGRPVLLPTPDEILERVYDLERLLTTDTARGNQALRGLIRDGSVTLHRVQGQSVFEAETEFLPLRLPLKEIPPRPEASTVYSVGCGDRI